MTKQRVLITGGAGFVGSHIADAYLAAGYEIGIIDNLSTGQRSNIPNNANFYELNLLDAAGVKSVIGDFKPNIINHHAAHTNLRKSIESPSHDAQVNIIGLLHLLEAARPSAVNKIIFASSGGAIYSTGAQPFTESSQAKPISPYGIAKLTSEYYLDYYQNQYSTRIVCLRYSNVYGPRQHISPESGVVSIFTNALLGNRNITIFGDGTHTRDYVYVEDVAAANILATEKDIVGTYNISTGKATSTNELFNAIRQAIGSNIEPVYEPLKYPEQNNSLLSPIEAGHKLSWAPQYELRSGIEKTVAWYREKLAAT